MEMEEMEAHQGQASYRLLMTMLWSFSTASFARLATAR
ncbi:hypothetical protein C4J97_3515 [Pseudomonas orientalis]|nr:hypothetical protein C4J97_3515 [Pseudomonas orientalis]